MSRRRASSRILVGSLLVTADNELLESRGGIFLKMFV